MVHGRGMVLISGVWLAHLVPEAISEKLEPMQRVQRLVACYEEPRDPDKLDCVVTPHAHVRSGVKQSVLSVSQSVSL